MEYRFATAADPALLAGMNKQLILDDGHRNPMTLTGLKARMAGWLSMLLPPAVGCGSRKVSRAWCLRTYSNSPDLRGFQSLKSTDASSIAIDGTWRYSQTLSP